MTKNEDQRDSVGKISRELQLQDDRKINPIDLQRAIHKGNKGEDSFESQLLTCLERGKKEMEGKFFIVVLFKKERIMQNVVRQYFLYRYTCPTPEFDQTVYSFDPKGEDLRYIWTIPDQKTVTELCLAGKDLPEEYRALQEFCRDYTTGRLDKKCAQLNGEEWVG